MTTDSVGVIMPQIIKTFGLGMAAAGSFHYATMTGIALGGICLGGICLGGICLGGICLGGICLGFLADRLGRKSTIVLGLVVFSAVAFLFAVGDSFGFFVTLLVISGALGADHRSTTASLTGAPRSWIGRTESAWTTSLRSAAPPRRESLAFRPGEPGLARAGLEAWP